MPPLHSWPTPPQIRVPPESGTRCTGSAWNHQPRGLGLTYFLGKSAHTPGPEITNVVLAAQGPKTQEGYVRHSGYLRITTRRLECALRCSCPQIRWTRNCRRIPGT